MQDQMIEAASIRGTQTLLGPRPSAKGRIDDKTGAVHLQDPLDLREIPSSVGLLTAALGRLSNAVEGIEGRLGAVLHPEMTGGAGPSRAQEPAATDLGRTILNAAENADTMAVRLETILSRLAL